MTEGPHSAWSVQVQRERGPDFTGSEGRGERGNMGCRGLYLRTFRVLASAGASLHPHWGCSYLGLSMEEPVWKFTITSVFVNSPVRNSQQKPFPQAWKPTPAEETHSCCSFFDPSLQHAVVYTVPRLPLPVGSLFGHTSDTMTENSLLIWLQSNFGTNSIQRKHPPDQPA